MMRIRRLDLERFGHFTGQHLDFGPALPGKSDFHLVHGPNEAGKTTLMEAFLGLLYGFENAAKGKEKKSFAFLHSKETLQVGGLLEIGGKETLLTRVKRRGSSLLDRDQQPLPEAVLESVLGGLGLEEYRKLLCLDDSTIEKGGEEILKSEGDIGSLLFSAAAGVSGLSAVLAQTGGGAEAFYKKGGSKSEHAKLRKELEDIARQIRESDVTAHQYRKLIDDLDKQKGREQALRIAREQAEAGQRRLTALIEAHGLASKWAEPKAELVAISHYPASIDIDPEHLFRMVAEQAGLIQKQHDASLAMARLEGQLGGIAVSPVVELHGALEALDPLKGRAQGASEDLPKRIEERAGLLAEMAAALSGLGVEPGEPQRFALPQHRIKALAQIRDALASARLALATAQREDRDAHDRLQALEAELAAARGTIADLPDIDAILTAHDAERLVSETGKAAQAIAQAENAAREAKNDLQVEGANFSTMPAVSLTPQEASDHAQLISQAIIAQRHATAEAAKAQDDLRVVAARQESLASAGDLVDEQKAAAGRAHRDLLWQAHRGSLDAPSADAFEAAMRANDAIADLRQAQAARLAQLLEARLASGEAAAKAGNARHALEAAAAHLGHLQAVHEARLKEAGLPSGFPAGAFADWLEKRTRARKAALALVEARNHAKPLEFSAAALRQALGFLPEATAGTELSVLVRKAGLLAREQAVWKAKALAADTERNARARRDVQLKACESAAAASVAASREMLAQIFPAENPPSLDDAIHTLQRIRELNDKVKTLEDRSIAPMRRDLADFEGKIGELVASMAGFQGFPALECWRLLRQEVDAAREAQAQKARLGEQLAREQKEHQQASTRLEMMEREIAALGAVFPAGIAVGDLAQLRHAVAQTLRANALRSTIAQLQQQVIGKLGVDDIEAAQAMLAQTPLHEAEGQLAQFRQAYTEAQEALETAISARTSAAEALARVQGDADIAELSAERRAIEARMEEGTLHYLEDRFGVMLAERALRRYRDTHRSGMLKSAEAAFRMLTNGVYCRLTTQASGPGGTGETLIAIRERDGQSKLAAQMSKGTRFQLYLALRAAAYEQMSANGVVLPFFCDDIFETFDEERTSAACALMHRIGQQGQAIYLTHHAHVVEIARKVCGDAVSVHTLPHAGLAAA